MERLVVTSGLNKYPREGIDHPLHSIEVKKYCYMKTIFGILGFCCMTTPKWSCSSAE